MPFGPDQAPRFDEALSRAIETLLTKKLDVLGALIDAPMTYGSKEDGEAVTVAHVVRVLNSSDHAFDVLGVGIVCALLANPSALYDLIRQVRMKTLPLHAAVERVKFLLDQHPHGAEHVRSSTQPRDRA